MHLAGIATALVCAAFAASAQTPDAWTTCTKSAESAPDRAIESCSAIIQDGKETGGKLAAVYTSRAIAYFAKHDIQRVIADIREAARIDPKVPPNLAQFCGITVLKQNDDSGLAYCDEALRIDPKNVGAYSVRADRALIKRDYDTAISNLSEAIRLFQDVFPLLTTVDQKRAFAEQQTRFFNARGSAYAIKGNSDAAVDDFSEALRLTPGFASALQSRASLYETKRQYPKAARDFEELVRLDPGNAGAWNSSCWLHAVLGQLVRALNDCNESLRLAPNMPATLDSRALVHFKRNALTAAIEDYDAALKLDPKLATSLYGRGLAKRKRNDKAGGDADIAAAKALSPGVVELFASYGID
jgi:tetratricopeptide (TPR) repeat protein